MNLKNLTVRSRLLLGLGAITALVLTLAGLAWRQADLLWADTSDIYEHPLLVRRALMEVKADILSIEILMGDLAIARSDSAQREILTEVDSAEADARRQVGVLNARYLGPASDVSDLVRTLDRWRPVRDESVRLVRAGRRDEAAGRLAHDQVDEQQMRQALVHVEKISAFARDRADVFYESAAQRRAVLRRQLVVVSALILGLVGIVGVVLLATVRAPLAELTAVANEYRRGNLDVRSTYVSTNELGTLSAAFNLLAETLQVERQIDQQTAVLAGVMLHEEELHALSRALLQALLEQTGSQVGALYLLNAEATAFEHVESIGLDGTVRASFSAAAREGEFGAALATRKIQRITDIPRDTRFTFAGVSGNFQPREIITIPVPLNEGVGAMVSLASIRPYSEASVRLVHEVWNMLTARLSGVIAFQALRDASGRLEVQNRELETQARELSAQSAELAQHNAELAQQKAQLDEANRPKSTFLSNMSHELRTPLNSVIALAGVLGRRLATRIPEEEYGYLEIIERNGKNLLSLLNDILDLSRIEAGRTELHVTTFPAASLAGEVVSMLEAQATQQHITLACTVADDLPVLTSDREKCRHVLQNLVANAVKFTEHGSVTVSARQEGRVLHLDVTDTGIGIAAEQLEHIFDEFRQADGSTSRKYGGTGLGLAIARRYAMLLRGNVSVRSTLGEGSTFTFSLPIEHARRVSGEVAVPAGMPIATRRSGEVRAIDGRGKTILVVEDSEPAVIQMRDILREQGYAVQVACNGKEALAQIAQAVPDAVILDLMMPEVDGFQVLNTIRGTPETALLPVLILTAKHVSREEMRSLTGNNIHQLIQKGDIRRAELLDAIAEMVTLPATPVAPAPTAAPVPRAAASTRSAAPRVPRDGKPLVLVVEDNADNLRTAHALLKDRFTVVEATDGRSGVAQASLHRPDVILMDVSLPEVDGITALATLRADAKLRHIPVIAVTASAMKGDREELLAHGFDGYVSKPIEAAVLERVMEEVLGAE